MGRVHAVAATLLVAIGSGAVVMGTTAPRRSAATQPPPAGGSGQGQAPNQPTEPRPTFRTEANYVRVDVYPTAGGVPVADLAREDFEVLEDGTPQRIDQFEFVRVQANVPETAKREPQTVAESREMAREPRARVFVVFLDTYHTSVGGSHRMRTALTTMLRRVLAPDDLFGVMTPEMSAKDVTLARRTEVTEEMLARHWAWGRRDQETLLDADELAYKQCYADATAPVTYEAADPRAPDRLSPDSPGQEMSEVAQEMIVRRREKLTLDALDDLSLWLRDVREERKAVLVVSDGWRLYRPNRGLANANTGRPPAPPGTGVVDGRLTSDVGRDRYSDPLRKCETDRAYLAQLDNDRRFRDLLERANRANVSFYPIDSRGLPVFDSSIGEDYVQPGGTRGPVPVGVDRVRLRERLDALMTMASVTDGLAVVNSNDVDRGLQRIVADLTSYYLLGYYSSNPKLDGRFRSIAVRVKRPGVEVRARRGYLAATEAEVEAGTRAESLPAAAGPPPALERALGGLAALRPDTRVRSLVSWLAGPAGRGGSGGRVWLDSELSRTMARDPQWTSGARVEATLTGGGATLATTTLDLAPGGRLVSVDLPDVAFGDGEMLLRVRLTPAAGGLPLVESVRFVVPDGATVVGMPRVSRRGPSTGAAFVRTGDAEFRRNEQLRVETPLSREPQSVRAELLDRVGRVVAVPVAARVVVSDGVTWAVGELPLAPLAAGDYAVRTTAVFDGAAHESLAAFRVVP